jgi:hypothetical protein
MDIGATRFIQKPIELDGFLTTVEELLLQDTPVPLEPLNERKFYEGYHERLEAKLEQKDKQIARDELLLGTKSEEEHQYIQTSLYQDKREREELKLLLDQVHAQLQKLTDTFGNSANTA